MGRPSLTAADHSMLDQAAKEGLFSRQFVGKRISLTGTMSLSRRDMVAVLQAAGAIYEERPRLGTHFLVVGDTKAHGMTAKINDAIAMDIEILEEHQFAALVTIVDL